MNKEFTGIFKEEFERFIEFKKAQGVYKNIDEKLLYDYLHINRFLDSYDLNEIIITKEMFDAYMNEEVAHLSQSTRHHHECNFRQFSKFLKNQGYENIYIQYDTVVRMPRDYIPYVFSKEEMARIFSVIDGLNGTSNKNSAIFYQTFIRLLYATGLRLGEALDLKIEDVDLENNILTVNAGKGNVSRLVPFKASLSEVLKKYYGICHRPDDIYFFESPNKGKRCGSSISNAFRNRILPKAEIDRHKFSKGRGACIHSLRHTFACHSLDQMIKEGKDPYCALPYLSFYLGHTSIVNTEIYLRLTLERHDEITDAGHYIYKESLGGIHE